MLLKVNLVRIFLRHNFRNDETPQLWSDLFSKIIKEITLIKKRIICLSVSHWQEVRQSSASSQICLLSDVPTATGCSPDLLVFPQHLHQQCVSRNSFWAGQYKATKQQLHFLEFFLNSLKTQTYLWTNKTVTDKRGAWKPCTILRCIGETCATLKLQWRGYFFNL